MIDILLLFFAVFMLCVICALIRGLLYVIERGLMLTEDLINSGATLGNMWRGRVSKTDDGSMVSTREGIRLSSRNGVRKLIPTRSIKRDIH